MLISLKVSKGYQYSEQLPDQNLNAIKHQRSEALKLHSRFCPRAFANLGKLVALLGNETEVND